MVTSRGKTRQLQVKPLGFPATALAQWERGRFDLLDGLPPSSFPRRILDEKTRNRRRPGRRFFGESFVATHVVMEAGWYGSFKWLTSWPVHDRSKFGVEYRSALTEHFPSVTDIASRSLVLRNHLGDKKPMPPDLWLIVNGEHHFIEVKLPRDPIRPTQIAGLALIATCLQSTKDVSVWLYNLYPEDSQPDPVPSSVKALYRKFCRVLTTAD